MAESLSRQIESLKLTQEEKGKQIEVGDNVIAQCDQNLLLSLACKILTSRTIHHESFRTMIPRIWGVEDVKIRGVGKNIFVCQFSNPRDKKGVVNAGSWFFDKGVLAFEDLRADTSIGEMEFRYVSFWIHLHKLPVAVFSKDLAKSIGNLIGKYEKIDCDEDGLCWGQTMKIKVAIDVLKPLRRGVLLKLGSMADERWIPITYEKLPNFCYGCGKLDHVLKECDEHVPGDADQLQYGVWLRELPFSKKSRKESGLGEDSRSGRGRGRSSRKNGQREQSSDGESSENSGDGGVDGDRHRAVPARFTGNRINERAVIREELNGD